MTSDYRTTCPYCGWHHEAASPIMHISEADQPEPVPQDGAISLCGRCRRLAIFSFMTPGGLRAPQPGELREFEATDLGQRIRRALNPGGPL